MAEPENHETWRMQAGLRAWVARAARGTGGGLRRVSPPGLVALLCAGAFGPVLAMAAGSGAAVVAGIGVLGAVGANVLADVITTTIDALRGDDKTPTQDEIEEVLAKRIEELLVTDGTRAEQLRAEVARVLREIDAAGIALDAAIRTGDQELQSQLAEGLTLLSADFTEFAFVLTEVREAVTVIQETLLRQDVEHRVDRDRVRRQSIRLRRIENILAVIERRTQAIAGRGPEAESTSPRWQEGSPYRGLWPFEEEHADIFYGREQLTAELIVKLTEHLSGSGLLVVTGASGAGKSSLLRAGLLPALARGSLVTGAAEWPRVMITPTRAPLDELATHLAALGGMASTSVRRELAEHPENAHLTVRQILLAQTLPQTSSGSTSSVRRGRLVLVVDQFEEIFTLSRNEEAAAEAERQAFITALCAMAGTSSTQHDEPTALVVLGVQGGDLWDRCAAYPQLAEALRDGQFVVGPMTEPDLRRAITGPADAAGLEIDPSLPDTILSELRSTTTEPGGYGAGALPLLSQAMLITWEHRTGNRLTNRGYGHAGGIGHAVQTSADAAYDALTSNQRGIAREVFRRLTIVGRDGRLARRPVVRTDLYAAHANRRADVDAVLDAFTGKRLLVRDDDTTEIAHDALLHTWPRLRSWLEADQADSVLYSQLIDDAAEWHGHRRDPSFLYRGTQLAAVDQATTRWESDSACYPALTGTHRDFLDASHHAAARGARLRRLTAAGLVVLLIATTMAAVTAVNSANDAARQRKLVVSRQLATQSEAIGDTDPNLSLLLAGAAYHIAATPEARHSLLTALIQPVRAILPDTGGDLALSPDGSTLATTRKDAVVQLWDVTARRQIGTLQIGPADTVGAMAFSPDGNTLTTVGVADHSVVQSWNIATRRQIGASLTIGTGDDSPMTFSPDRRVLATIANNSVRLWDVVTGRRKAGPLAGHTGNVGGIAFSPDGKTLATGSADKTVWLWDVVTGRRKAGPLAGHTGNVGGIAFSPDGKTLATGSADKTVRLWSTAGQQISEPFIGHTDDVESLTFGPDGQTLATSGLDGTTRLWNIAARRQKGILSTGHTGPIYEMAFSPDGNMLATGSADKTIKLWLITKGRRIRTPLTGHAGAVYAVAFSPDGKTLATGSADKTVRLWDVVTGDQKSVPLARHADTVTEVAFSPDGKTLATASMDKTIRLWDIARGHQVGASLIGHTEAVWENEVAYNRNGKTLATASGDGTVRLWNVDTHHQIGTPLTGIGVAFSPDGKILATAGEDGTVRLWDVDTHRQIGAPLTGHTNPVNEVAFSSDGKILATTGDSIRLWDVDTHRQIGTPLMTGGGNENEVLFSPDGKTLATAGWEGVVRLWNVALPADLFASLCVNAGRSLSREEWNRYIPSEPYQQVCS